MPARVSDYFGADHHWAEFAACRYSGLPADTWFSDDPDIQRDARAVCRGCLVQFHCLSDAIADKALDGIWGGTTEEERHGPPPRRSARRRRT